MAIRHKAAVHLLESRVDPDVIKAWLGHASLASADRYLDTDLNHKRLILDRFGPPAYEASAANPQPRTDTDQFLDWLGEL